MIDILVGRHPIDLLNLSKGYEKYKQSSLDVALSTRVDDIFGLALSILLEFNRPLPTDPIDTALVSTDVNNIIRILTTSFPACRDLFNILLRRSDLCPLLIASKDSVGHGDSEELQSTFPSS